MSPWLRELVHAANFAHPRAQKVRRFRRHPRSAGPKGHRSPQYELLILHTDVPYARKITACLQAKSLTSRSYLKLESGSLGGGGMVSTSALPLLVTELRLFCSQMYSSIVQSG